MIKWRKQSDRRDGKGGKGFPNYWGERVWKATKYGAGGGGWGAGIKKLQDFNVESFSFTSLQFFVLRFTNSIKRNN
jgi:hypothetical protein